MVLYRYGLIVIALATMSNASTAQTGPHCATNITDSLPAEASNARTLMHDPLRGWWVDGRLLDQSVQQDIKNAVGRTAGEHQQTLSSGITLRDREVVRGSGAPIELLWADHIPGLPPGLSLDSNQFSETERNTIRAAAIEASDSVLAGETRDKPVRILVGALIHPEYLGIGSPVLSQAPIGEQNLYAPAALDVVRYGRYVTDFDFEMLIAMRPDLGETVLERTTLHEMGHGFGFTHQLSELAEGITYNNRSETFIERHIQDEGGKQYFDAGAFFDYRELPMQTGLGHFDGSVGSGACSEARTLYPDQIPVMYPTASCPGAARSFTWRDLAVFSTLGYRTVLPVSGLWFDPSLNGSGLNVVALDGHGFIKIQDTHDL